MNKNLIALAAVAACGAAVGAGLGPQSYVQEGLVSQVDGEFNAVDANGTPIHSATATTWRDLKANADFSWNIGKNGTYSVGDKWYVFGGSSGRFSRNVTGFVNALTANGGFTVEKTSTYVSLNILGISARIGGSGMYYQSGNLTHTTSTGQRGGWKPTAAQVLTSGSIVYTPSADASEIRPFYNGRHDEGSANVTYKSTYKPSEVFDIGNIASDSHSATGMIFAVRLYDRRLTDAEVEHNYAVDGIRFRAFNWTGSAGTDWTSAANWTAPLFGSGAPSAATAAVRISGEVVPTVAAETTVELLGVDGGASIAISSGVALRAKMAYVDGQPVARGIYTGSGSLGTKVAWLSGEGVLQVAGGLGLDYPTTIPTPAEDGSFVFGATGYKIGAYGGKTYCKAENPAFSQMLFPANPVIKFKDGILISSALPEDASVDVTALKSMYLGSNDYYPPEMPIVIPSGARFRYMPGTFAVTTGLWYYTAKNADLKHDIEMNGAWDVNDYSPYTVIRGKLSGTGSIETQNFGKEIKTYGVLDFNGKIQFGGGACGTHMLVYSPKITGKIKKITMEGYGAGSTWRFESSWYKQYVLFDPTVAAGQTADPLRFEEWATADGNFAYDSKTAKWWRYGNALFFWGGNKVVIDKVTGTGAMHVVADNNLNLTARAKTGDAYLEVGNVSSTARLYLSTNVYVTVGSVSAGETFDYACESNATTAATLDITGSCSTAAKVKARDIAMLPARLKGFTGSVTLTETEEKAYAMTLDLSKGTEALYTTDGCNGSGTLAAAPTAGTVNVTLSGDRPLRGEYALARFTSGGEKLANWTVNVVGHEGESQFTVGSGENMKIVTVKKDATGLWLKVTNPGLQIFLR